MEIKNSNLLENFNVNQIVNGVVCGTFVILGFRVISEEWFVQLKCVNAYDHTQTSPGELALPLANIRAIDSDLAWRKEQLRQIAADEPVTVIRKSTAREIELTSFAIPARPRETAEYTDEQREIQ